MSNKFIELDNRIFNKDIIGTVEPCRRFEDGDRVVQVSGEASFTSFDNDYEYIIDVYSITNNLLVSIEADDCNDLKRKYEEIRIILFS